LCYGSPGWYGSPSGLSWGCVGYDLARGLQQGAAPSSPPGHQTGPGWFACWIVVYNITTREATERSNTTSALSGGFADALYYQQTSSSEVPGTFHWLRQHKIAATAAGAAYDHRVMRCWAWAGHRWLPLRLLGIRLSRGREQLRAWDQPAPVRGRSKHSIRELQRPEAGEIEPGGLAALRLSDFPTDRKKNGQPGTAAIPRRSGRFWKGDGRSAAGCMDRDLN